MSRACVPTQRRDSHADIWHALLTPTLTLPDDERTAAFQQNIDRCEFRIIRLYVESPQTNIKAAFVVDRSIRLEQVAVVAAFGDDATMRRLIRAIPTKA